ncbi:MAG: tRNA glutamyl-Q(34) synthetase GluQRS [Pseudomonadota bacterium]
MARWRWTSRKKKLSLHKSQYRGRFAPSPTGPLHFGSLVAAVGSFLDARHHHGIWLIRMEDLDTPRCVPGAADDILRTLDAFGLHSDEPVIYQSQRTAAYDEALQRLQDIGAAYPCCCTRKEIADSALHGIDGFMYPGTCRSSMAHQRPTPAWRVRTDHSPITFDDALQGCISQNLASEIGDFVVKRADGLFAYQLAVVVDDAFQQIRNVVRGADLLNSTARQIHLQNLLGLPTPHYMHLPVAVNAAGEKLSKQTLAQAVDSTRPVHALWRALAFLQQQPPQALQDERPDTVWEWARRNWHAERLVGCRALPAMADELDHRGNE